MVIGLGMHHAVKAFVAYFNITICVLQGHAVRFTCICFCSSVNSCCFPLNLSVADLHKRPEEIVRTRAKMFSRHEPHVGRRN